MTPVRRATAAFDRVLNRILDRVLDALADPRRAGRAVAILLVLFWAAWTLYGAVAKGSQDIHFDMGEMVAWSREVTLGTTKHPPLGAWLAGLWFSVLPLADWSYYLFAMGLATVSLWAAYMAAAPYLDRERRAVGLALLSLVPLFNFHALKYNANTVMMPLWGLATWTFLRAFETRKAGWALAAGVAAGAAMLGKYWSAMLLVGLGLAAVADPRRRAYFASAAPWLTITAGALVLAPHLLWLYAHDFATFAYAVTSHSATLVASAASGLGYVLGALAYGAPVIVGFALLRPSRAVWRDTMWPGTPERRLVVLAFALPLVLPAVAAVATKSAVVSLWAIGSMTLLPVVVLSSPRLDVPRPAARRILAAALALPLVAILASPMVAIVVHRQGVPNRATHYRALALKVERLWAATTDRPLRLVSSYDNLAYGTVFYFVDRPSAFEINNPDRTPWVDAARIAREGVAYYCPVDEERCMRALDARLAATPPARRAEVEISRSYLGAADHPERYVIAIVPPR
jgi:4-amino-4-deoxy-L-arabinose transferase-like glycosyltransferase